MAIRIFKYCPIRRESDEAPILLSPERTQHFYMKDPDLPLRQNFRLSPASQHTQPHRRCLIKKRRKTAGRGKKALERTKHDSLSASENSNLVPIQDTGRAKRVQSTSAAGHTLENQTHLISFQRSQSEHLSLSAQRPQIANFMPEIREHMLRQQSLYIPRAQVRADQTSESNRNKLCEWIFEIVGRYRFKLETGFKAVNMTDRMLGLRSFRVNDLALLGITCLFMAAKYEEVKVPLAEDFCQLVAPSYRVSREVVFQLEGIILLLLNFDMNYCSPLNFIQDVVEQKHLSSDVAQRAIQLAKQLIVGAQARYWPASDLASYCVQSALAQQHFPENE